MAAIGALKGISIAMRRWRASFWAERSMYFCIDSFYMSMLVYVRGDVLRRNSLYIMWVSTWVPWCSLVWCCLVLVSLDGKGYLIPVDVGLSGY